MVARNQLVEASIDIAPVRSSVGRIVVVDDLESSLHLLTRLLERDGHAVFPTTDSTHAVRFVAETQPDLVFLDVMMPNPDGFDICRELKRNVGYCDLLLAELPDGDPRHADLLEVHKAARAAMALVPELTKRLQ